MGVRPIWTILASAMVVGAAACIVGKEINQRREERQARLAAGESPYERKKHHHEHPHPRL